MIINKKNPVGIENYEIVHNECFYVDKTLLIKELIDLPTNSVVLYTRPRRFGKSLNLSMVKYFFDKKLSTLKLFQDTKINMLYPEYMDRLNKYPVIHISFKNVVANNFENFILELKEIMSEVYLELLNNIELNEIDQKYVCEIINKSSDNVSLFSSLFNLIKLLYKYQEKRVVILIDEYDAPAQSAFENNYYDDFILFYKQFLSKALKGNEFIQFGMLTGVLELAKESLFSGLNNLFVNNISTINKTEFFGFEKNDIEKLINELQLPYSFDELNKYYGGYKFGDKTVLNPWSILNYFKTEKIGAYWTNTGANLIIGNIISNGDKELFLTLEKLFNFESIPKQIDLTLGYTEIEKREDALYSFLLQTGYITYLEQTSFNTYLLKIPNYEVKELFKKEICDKHISSRQITTAYKFKDAIKNNKIDEIKYILEEYILSSLSYYDFNNEKSYQILLLGMIALLFDDCDVKSEGESGDGRADIIIESKNDISIVIELKKLSQKVSKERLDNSSKAALKQIIDKNYVSSIKSSKHILLYGVSFSKRNVSIASSKIK